MAKDKEIVVKRIYMLDEGTYDAKSYVVIDDGIPSHKLKKLPLSKIKGQKGDKGDKGDTGPQGADGADGRDGADGFSPEVTIEPIEPSGGNPGGYEITITSAEHPEGQTFEIYDGRDGSGGGGSYTAGDAISIAEDIISVKIGSGLELDETADHKLQVKLGKGLAFNEEQGVEAGAIEIDTDVSDVVATVQELAKAIDSQLVTNYSVAGITKIMDIGSTLKQITGVTEQFGLTVYNAFTVPINEHIRLGSADESPTLFGVYAFQSHGDPVIFGLYEYDFDTQSSDYVADTGAVYLGAGHNEFPLVHINPRMKELSSGKLYYTALHLKPQHSASGPILLTNEGMHDVSGASYTLAGLNLNPQLAVWSKDDDNHPIIDFTDPDVGLNVPDDNPQQSGRNYKYGPWSGGYARCYDMPSFYVQIRNGTPPVPHTEPFDNIDNYTLQIDSVQSIFNTTGKMVLQAVKPYLDVDIVSWDVYDCLQQDSAKYGGDVYTRGSNSWTKFVDSNNVTVQELGVVATIDGVDVYGRRYTPSSPVHLSADTTYWFAATGGGNWADIANVVRYAGNDAVTKDLYSCNNPGYVHDSTMTRATDVRGTFLSVTDSNGDTYVI